MSADRVELWRCRILMLVGLALGTLADCAQQPPPPPAQAAAVPPPAPAPPPPARRRSYPLPPRKPAPPPDNAVLGMETTPESTRGETEAMIRVPTAGDLIGLDEATAARLFGTTSEQADVPPARVWRYRAAHCELDLFFYLDLGSGKMRTLRYALKGDSADPVGRQSCLRSLVVARRE